MSEIIGLGHDALRPYLSIAASLHHTGQANCAKPLTSAVALVKYLAPEQGKLGDWF